MPEYRLSLLSLVLFSILLSVAPNLTAQVSNPVPYRNGVVSSADELASAAGLEILKQGGNAIDAAVAVQFVLAVTLPRAGNIGGGGFMVLHLADGTVTTLDFREKAPGAATRDMYLDRNGEYLSEKSKIGPLAAGVPGTVDGMISALERYGTLPLEIVMEPAIKLAEEGYRLTASQAESLNRASNRLRQFEGSRQIFVKKNGTEWNTGDHFVQTDLAESLNRIAIMGRRGFYAGLTARLIVNEMQRTGGIITMRDLREYRSVWRDPLKSEFRGYDIFMMPPPSSGGVVMDQVLKMIDIVNPDSLEFNSAEYIHLLTEAFRRSFADRNFWLGDADFMDIPIEKLTAINYLTERMSDFSTDYATASEDVTRGDIYSAAESFETTHFNVVDKHGNAVAVNTTLNGSFGSYTTVTGAGFLLNNEMDDFSAKPGTPNMFGLTGAEANAIAPGKRMLSSMSPTIAVKDGIPRFIGGGAGGPTIITATLQNFLNMALFDMNAIQSISAPRFHHQWLPDRLMIEGLYFSPDTIRKLGEKGHTVLKSGNIALIHTIMIDQNGLIYGASDPRGNGSVKGY
jgi:gamma-glutamyltranspeptidase / glutathione hydrolase